MQIIVQDPPINLFDAVMASRAVAGLEMQINGHGRWVPVADYAAASAQFLAAQDRIGYRGPEDRTVYPRSAILRQNGVAVARISQNGRVWAGTEYVAGAASLYDPR